MTQLTMQKPPDEVLLNYDPMNSLKHIKCPVLALNGERDVQVAIDEYATIEQTIDPLVLEEISGWVLKQTK